MLVIVKKDVPFRTSFLRVVYFHESCKYRINSARPFYFRDARYKDTTAMGYHVIYEYNIHNICASRNIYQNVVFFKNVINYDL